MASRTKEAAQLLGVVALVAFVIWMFASATTFHLENARDCAALNAEYNIRGGQCVDDDRRILFDPRHPLNEPSKEASNGE